MLASTLYSIYDYDIKLNGKFKEHTANEKKNNKKQKTWVQK